jgi:hypothetical protein
VPGPAAPAAAPSVAFIPALTVSIKTPLISAGEYGDMRSARGGCGAGGMGRRRLPCILALDCVAGVGALDFDFTGLEVDVDVTFV